ncbi:MAG: protein translocase subunit SecF [Clostridiales Family XIII bacterium]|jgi:SecD/SecF fusion protein|nr:protein translocase subunit SecF [Clostridiales Family XIII bacterium]
MAKRISTFVIFLVIAFLWVITLTDVIGIGPIQKDIKLGLDISGGVYVVMEADTDKKGEELKKIMEQAQSVIERRVNLMGLSEPIVTIEGDNRIRVELPGAEDSNDAIDAIGKTAQLKFIYANGEEILTGTDVKDSGIELDQDHGGYAVSLKFDSKGGDAFYEATGKASSGQITGPFLSDEAYTGEAYEGAEQVTSGTQIVIVLDNTVISAPNASSPIQGGNAVITGGSGGFAEDEAVELSTLIRGGALPVPLKEVEASEVGATIGMGALSNSILGGIIGVGLIVLIMLVMYKFLGLAACLSLGFYIPAMLWILVLLKGVLTLPGIAGIILSIGMAVDANVIIYSRVKEEVQEGKSVRVATKDGFKRAMGTIIDSQITTMIAGVILYIFGTGPVRGFALTLMIGIVLGIISAVFITHILVDTILSTKALSNPKILGLKENRMDHNVHAKVIPFIEHRKVYYIVTLAILVVGFGTGLIRGYNYGIDFTGGTRITIDYQENVKHEDLQKYYEDQGLENVEIVDSGQKLSEVMVKTTTAMNKDERNALLDKVYDKYGISDKDVISFEQFGPSVGDSLKLNAVKSILLSAVFMLIYVTFRFKWRFGVAAIAAVLHDVLIMLALYGLFHFTINNPFIAAILTVVGYSINDTIVIFDRIRENLVRYRKMKPIEMIDVSINQTLVRSILTSLTTVCAIVPIAILGGDSINQFTVPLIIGIVAGTFSSIFIASPLYYDIDRLTNANKGYLDTHGKTKSSQNTKGKSNGKAKKPAKSKSDGAVV